MKREHVPEEFVPEDFNEKGELINKEKASFYNEQRQALMGTPIGKATVEENIFTQQLEERKNAEEPKSIQNPASPVETGVKEAAPEPTAKTASKTSSTKKSG